MTSFPGLNHYAVSELLAGVREPWRGQVVSDSLSLEIGDLLGQAARHGPGEPGLGSLSEAAARRDLMAARLAVVERAIESVTSQLAGPPAPPPREAPVPTVAPRRGKAGHWGGAS